MLALVLKVYDDAMSNGTFMRDLQTMLQISNVVTTTSQGWLLFDTNLIVRDCNPAAVRLFKLSREELLGRTMYDLPWSAENHKGVALADQERPAVITLRTGTPTLDTVMGLRVSGRIFRWFAVSTFPAVFDGVIEGVLASYVDVTEWETNRRNLEIALEISQIGRSADSDVDYLERLCSILVSSGGFALAFITSGIGSSTKLISSAGLVEELGRHFSLATDDKLSGEWITGKAARSGAIQVANDLDDHATPEHSRPVISRLQFRSGIAVPFKASESKLVLNIFSRHDHRFDDVTVRQLESTVREVEFAISHVLTNQKLQLAFEGTLKALAQMSEVRDPYTAGHQRNVGRLGAAIADWLGMDAETVRLIDRGGLVHDVGKISIPAEILTRPGPLNSIEIELMKNHPSIGAQILTHASLPWPIPEIALQHHERIDGSGYPQGLPGEEIVLPARIIAVADVVEAMAHHRPYRAALGIDQALDEITRGAGTIYDGNVADACKAVFDAGFTFDHGVYGFTLTA